MLDAMKRWLALLALLMLIMLGTTAWAQTVSLGLTISGAVPKPELALYNLALGTLRLDLRAAVAVPGPLELGLGLRTTLSLGAVGNVILSGRGDLTTHGLFSSELSGSAVVGGVAVRARLAAFNTNPGQFDLREAFAASARHWLPERGRVGSV